MIALIFTPLHFTLWQYPPLCLPQLLHLDVPITSSLEFGSCQSYCGHTRTCLIGSIKPDARPVVGENKEPGNPALFCFLALMVSSQPPRRSEVLPATVLTLELSPETAVQS